MKQITLGLAAAWVAGGMAMGLAEEAQPDPSRDPATLVQDGRALYALHCSHCHGFNMVNPGTVAYDLRRFPGDQKPRFVESVTHGKNNRMPPWGDVLTPGQIDELWAYIRTGGKS